jgi:isoquinoline 1-oxidoreductase beta subunit
VDTTTPPADRTATLKEKTGFRPSRRALIFGGVAATGGLALGWAFTPFSNLPGARRLMGSEGEIMLQPWLRIGKDDSVTVIAPHMDFGQGSQTSLAMMLAEELDADWSHVRFEEAAADPVFANGSQLRMFANELAFHDAPIMDAALYGITTKIARGINMQLTAGSSAIRATGVYLMRPTGAAARWMLRRAAADAWNVPMEEVQTHASVLSHPASNRTARYGEMAEAAARFKPPNPHSLALKPKSAYSIVGKTQPRLDLPAKVDGASVFPHDLRLPGMLYGAVRQCPVIGGTLVSCDPAPALAMRGVSKVAKGSDVVIVLADNTWRARKAAAALDPKWDVSKLDVARTSSARVVEEMAKAVNGGAKLHTDHKAGDVDAALAASAKKLRAIYRVPYLAHAQMAPWATVAHFKDGHLTLWLSSQNPLLARHQAAEHAGLSMDKVTIHNLKMGGGFGRGDLHDFVMHAIDAAKQSNGVPVQTSWSREQDMTHGGYRQASVAKLEGGLDDKGRIVAYRSTYTEKRDLPEASAIPYSVPNLRISHVDKLNPLRWGFWRSVDNSIQGFFNECFVDELAHAAGQDPLAFRLAQCDERSKGVLRRVAEISNWGQPPAPGRARGVAVKHAFDSVTAQVAEVSIDDDGHARVHTMYTVVDPGLVINPGNLTRQVQGAVNWSLSATLHGAITFENGAVIEQNYPDYEVMKMADAPHQVVAFMESPNSRVGGGGEAGVPGVAPTVCNAIFALTGHRIRELPLRLFDLRTGKRFTDA